MVLQGLCQASPPLRTHPHPHGSGPLAAPLCAFAVPSSDSVFSGFLWQQAPSRPLARCPCVCPLTSCLHLLLGFSGLRVHQRAGVRSRCSGSDPRDVGALDLGWGLGPRSDPLCRILTDWLGTILWEQGPWQVLSALCDLCSTHSPAASGLPTAFSFELQATFLRPSSVSPL